MASDIDPLSKQILEKLLYKTKEVLSKDSLEEHYTEQIKSLNSQLEQKAKRIEDLMSENQELKKRVIESSITTPRDYVKTIEPLSFTVKSVKATKRVSTKIQNLAPNKFNVYEEFNQRLTSLFNIFHSLNSDDGIYTLMSTVENSFKYSMNCDKVVIVRRINDYRCKCDLSGQVVIFPDLENLLTANSLLVANTILPDDNFVNTVYSNNFYSIYNYMVLPKRNDKERLASELIIFLNKKDNKNANMNFNKLDEIFGLLSGHIYSLVSNYNDLIKLYDKSKLVAKKTIESIAELLSYVRNIITALRTP